MRDYGLDPVLCPGWDDPQYAANAGLSLARDPKFVIIHDTGTEVPTERLTDTLSLEWILSGVQNSSGRTVRACHFYVSRSGKPYITYAYPTWHAGRGGPYGGVARNEMNGWSYGIEHESSGLGWDLTDEMVATGVKMIAAALDVADQPTSSAINHKTWAPERKVDTKQSDAWWQSRIAVARLRAGGGGSKPLPVVSLSGVQRNQWKDVRLVQSGLNKVMGTRLVVNGRWDFSTQSVFDRFRREKLGLVGSAAAGEVGKASLTALGDRAGFRVA